MPFRETQMNRRQFLKTASLAASLPLFAHRASAQPVPEIVLKTPSGQLRGSVENGIHVFRGVPFAQPPVGSLRFRPPAPSIAWKGILDALAFAPAAFQPNKPKLPQSEDCLYLNVWAPAGPGPFPVFVWIHGGGFTNGSSFDAAQNGANFANAGIVCVTIAYRLGVFGFLDFSALLGDSFQGGADNGLRDIIESLRWVQTHIHAFGGDPDRVTVGGESAGAKLTGILMGTPDAKGLFHQMVSESGGAERIWGQAEARAVGEGFGEDWTGSAHATSSLQEAPPADLIATQKRFTHRWPKHFPLRPELDAGLVPRLPVETIEAGNTQGKRLLIGSNLDESALFVGPHPQKVMASELGNESLAQFEKTLAQYQTLYPQMTAGQRIIRALSAEEYWIPSLRVVDALVRGGGTAWVYRLDYAPKDGPLHGYAYHSEDVRLVWDDAKGGRDDAAAEAALQAQIHAAWCAFIRGEAPAATGLPAWPTYNLASRPTMIFDQLSRIADNPAGEEFALWAGLLAP